VRSAVVVGDAFRPPQERRVLLCVVVVRPHLGGSDALHVPEMENSCDSGYMKSPRLPDGSANASAGMMSYCEEAVFQTAAELDRPRG